MGVGGAFQECVSKGCPKCFKHVSNLFQECYNAFMFSGCFLGVSGKIREEFSNEDVLKDKANLNK